MHAKAPTMTRAAYVAQVWPTAPSPAPAPVPQPTR